ncbi:MAG: putative zinc-binding protein [Thermodesulfobacterium sp.]|nr:putative zinc-binding protein [Thermodesulfobacterium sp.]
MEEVKEVVEDKEEVEGKEVEGMDNNQKSGKAKIAIFTCAGGSNTGQLANAIGIKLVKANLGYMVCLAGIAAGIKTSFKKVSQAKDVIVIDGCPKSCAKKILEKAGIEINYHYDVTKLGIKKVPGSIDFTPQEVEIVEKFITENLNSI